MRKGCALRIIRGQSAESAKPAADCDSYPSYPGFVHPLDAVTIPGSHKGPAHPPAASVCPLETSWLIRRPPWHVEC